MKKKLLAMGIIACLLAVAIVGGSLAYFIDNDVKINTFKAGSGTDPDDPGPDGGTLEIEQNENNRDGSDYGDEEKPLFPYVPNPEDKDNDGHIDNDDDDNTVTDTDGYNDGHNYIDKIVTVENIGKESAYIRNFVAVPTELADKLHLDFAKEGDTSTAAKTNPTSPDSVLTNLWNWDPAYTITIDYVVDKDGNFEYDEDTGELKVAEKDVNGNSIEPYTSVKYTVYPAYYNGILEKNGITAPTLLGVYLDSKVDSTMDENGNATFSYNGVTIDFDLDATQILVATEAVQTAGFDFYESHLENARYALETAFAPADDGYNPFTPLPDPAPAPVEP